MQHGSVNSSSSGSCSITSPSPVGAPAAGKPPPPTTSPVLPVMVSSPKGTKHISQTTSPHCEQRPSEGSTVTQQSRSPSRRAYKRRHPLKMAGGDEVECMEWTPELTTSFLEFVVEEIEVGNKPHKCLSKPGYDGVRKKIMTRHKLDVFKKQMKKFWEYLKRQYKAWDTLLKYSRLGYDQQTGRITASKSWWRSWWRKAKKEIPGYSVFEKEPLQNRELMEKIFAPDIASNKTEGT